MEIKVIKKSKQSSETNQITLLFKKSHLRYQGRKTPIVTMYDERGEYLPVSVKLTQVQSRVPSTLLARWINVNCAEKLLTLVNRCHTVERIQDGVGGKWYFTNKDFSLYGLHKYVIKEDGKKLRVLKVDDSLGMQSVFKILSEIGVDIESEYDKVYNKMKQINLKGV